METSSLGWVLGVVPGVHRRGRDERRELPGVGPDGAVAAVGLVLDEGVVVGDVGGHWVLRVPLLTNSSRNLSPSLTPEGASAQLEGTSLGCTVMTGERAVEDGDWCVYPEKGEIHRCPTLLARNLPGRSGPDGSRFRLPWNCLPMLPQCRRWFDPVHTT